MKHIKQRFIADFEQSCPDTLSFDVTQLPKNVKKPRFHMRKKVKRAIIGTIIGVSVASVLVLVAIPLSTMLQVTSSVKVDRRNYSINEIKIAESNTFKKLNDISYPNLANPKRFSPLESEKTAYYNFANQTYHALANASNLTNLSYSPIGLYSVMNEMVGAVSNDDLKLRLESLLGLDEAGRQNFYRKLLWGNSFATDDATIQQRNAAFFNYLYDYSPDYVNYLTSLYCEAYQIDFDRETSKMTEWINKAVHADGYVNDQFFGIDDETALFLFSTLYFKNAWTNKYLTDKNVNDNFYLEDGTIIQTDYMRHSYTSSGYYDYGDYISFKDYYVRGSSVTYLVPKSTEDNIYSLTKDVNIFEEDEDRRVTPSIYSTIMINLKTPKFRNKGDVNFKSCLISLGFEDMFDRSVDSFHNAFTGEKAEDRLFYLQNILQRNEVEFNEDGSTVRSLTMGSFGGAMSSGPAASDTLDIELNQPFIYIIRDYNNNPIFVGHVDNPKA